MPAPGIFPSPMRSRWGREIQIGSAAYGSGGFNIYDATLQTFNRQEPDHYFHTIPNTGTDNGVTANAALLVDGVDLGGFQKTSVARLRWRQAPAASTSTLITRPSAMPPITPSPALPSTRAMLFLSDSLTGYTVAPQRPRPLPLITRAALTGAGTVTGGTLSLHRLWRGPARRELISVRPWPTSSWRREPLVASISTIAQQPISKVTVGTGGTNQVLNLTDTNGITLNGNLTGSTGGTAALTLTGHDDESRYFWHQRRFRGPSRWSTAAP